MKTLLITVLLFLLCISSYSQTSLVSQEWAARFNGTGNTYDGSNKCEIDRFGNIYVSGFSDGAGTDMDFALLKYNPAGALLWSKTYDNPNHTIDDCYWMIIDNDGNIYQSGRSDTGFVTIKYNSSGDRLWLMKTGGPITADLFGNLYMAEGFSDENVFTFKLVKYNSEGIKLWEKNSNNKGAAVLALITDRSGNVFMTGEINNITGETNNINGADIATWNYDSAGNLLWESRYQFSSGAYYRGVLIKTDASGNTYVAGESTSSGISDNNFVTLKYNSAGEQQWAALYHGSEYNSQYIRGMALDNEQNVYITGESSYDYTTIKYNSDGEQQWRAIYNSEADFRDEVYGIAVDASANVYVTGWCSTTQSMDCVTIKYNTYGAQQWKQAYHGPVEGNNCTNSIFVDESGSVYVSGFSDGEGSAADIILIKYSQITEVNPAASEIPSKYSLSQNYPNPFNPLTTIEFSLPENAFVTLKVFDITGREAYTLVSEDLSSGAYKYNFNGTILPGGTYFYKLVTEKFTETKKMILVK